MYFSSSDQFYLHIFYFFVCFIAVAKLAKATRTDNIQLAPELTLDDSIRHKHHRHHHRHHHKKHTGKSLICQSAGSSLKSSASNGSGVDNLSLDEPDETLRSKPSPSSEHNHLTECQLKDMNTSQSFVSMNINENKVLVKSKDYYFYI